eukprot:6015147-Amphidinium_carterae.1
MLVGTCRLRLRWDPSRSLVSSGEPLLPEIRQYNPFRDSDTYRLKTESALGNSAYVTPSKSLQKRGNLPHSNND